MEIAARWARVEPWRISRAMPGTRMPKKSITPRKTSAGFSLIRLWEDSAYVQLEGSLSSISVVMGVKCLLKGDRMASGD
jgi:hypothetical protein